MRFKNKKTGAIYVVTSPSIEEVFLNNPEYEIVKDTKVKEEIPKETLEADKTDEVKEVKKSNKK